MTLNNKIIIFFLCITQSIFSSSVADFKNDVSELIKKIPIIQNQGIDFFKPISFRENAQSLGKKIFLDPRNSYFEKMKMAIGALTYLKNIPLAIKESYSWLKTQQKNWKIAALINSSKKIAALNKHNLDTILGFINYYTPSKIEAFCSANQTSADIVEEIRSLFTMDKLGIDKSSDEKKVLDDQTKNEIQILIAKYNVTNNTKVNFTQLSISDAQLIFHSGKLFTLANAYDTKKRSIINNQSDDNLQKIIDEYTKAFLDSKTKDIEKDYQEIKLNRETAQNNLPFFKRPKIIKALVVANIFIKSMMALAIYPTIKTFFSPLNIPQSTLNTTDINTLALQHFLKNNLYKLEASYWLKDTLEAKGAEFIYNKSIDYIYSLFRKFIFTNLPLSIPLFSAPALLKLANQTFTYKNEQNIYNLTLLKNYKYSNIASTIYKKLNFPIFIINLLKEIYDSR